MAVKRGVTKVPEETTTSTTGTTTPTNTKTTTVNNYSNASNILPEYQGAGVNKSNSYVNQGEGNYTYNEKTLFYEKTPTTTSTATPTSQTTPEVRTGETKVTPATTTATSTPSEYQGTGAVRTGTTTTTPSIAQNIRDTWNAKSYAEQQELLKNNPNMLNELAKYGATPKEAEVKEEKPEEVKTGETKGWDYQDNSPERMAEIADNVNKFAVTDPDLFADENAFRNFFIDGKGRTPEQEKFLMDFYKNRKMYNKLDNYTSDQIGSMYVNGEIPDSYLTYLKNTDPERYNFVMDAKAKATDNITNQSEMDSLSYLSGDMDDKETIWGKMIEWAKREGLLVDKNGDLTDDRRYHEASEEEKNYVKEYSDNLARIMELQQTKRDMYDDYVKAYPGATKATILGLVNDATIDIQKEIDNLTVENTRLQGYITYAQSERQQMDKAGADTIAQLSDLYGMYYKTSPEGMSELAQAQYGAVNVTLSQANNGTYTQKQMALDNILTPYYNTYGDILFTSKDEIIDQVINYAKANGVSLQTALDNVFYTQLYSNPYYLQRVSGGAEGYGDWKVIGKDAFGNDVYGFVNSSTGVVVPYGTTYGTSYGTTGTTGTTGTSGQYLDIPRNVNGYKDNIGADTNNFGNITSMVEGAIGMYHSPNGRDYAVFANAEDGYNALLKDLQGKQTGNTRTGLNGNSTVAELIGTWVNGSGTVDPNSRYAKDFIKASGLSLNDKIGNVSTDKLAKGIMAGELTLSAYNKGGVDLSKYTPTTTQQQTPKFDNGLSLVYEDYLNANQNEKSRIAAQHGKTIAQMDAEVKEYSGSKNANSLKRYIDEIDRLLIGDKDLGGVEIPPVKQRMDTADTGELSMIGGWLTVGSSKQANRDWLYSHNLIRDNLTMENLVKLKGRGATFGALSDSEREAIGNAVSKLQPGLSEEEYKRELINIRAELVRSAHGYLDNYEYVGGTVENMVSELGMTK